MSYIIYFTCLGAGIMVALFSLVFSGDHEGGVSAGDAHAPEFSAFSPTTLGTFLASFGGLGLIFLNIPATAPVGIGGSLSGIGALGLTACVVIGLRKFMRKVQASSECKVGELLGTEATVSVPVPENAVGEVSYVNQGSLYASPARTEDGRPLPAGARVRIVNTSGPVFIVAAEAAVGSGRQASA